MTSAEKRQKVVNKGLSRKGKNQYNQDSVKRTKVGSGYSDCSSFTRWCYKEELSIDIGINTEAQIKSSKMDTVDVDIKKGIPDTSKLHKGDLFYFRGNDTSRTKGVGHVEMYIGNGKLLGHGSGIGPTEKSMDSYCIQRQSTKGNNTNKGLICVRRVIADDNADDKDDKTNDKKEETTSKPSTNYSTLLTGYTGSSIVDAFKSKKLDSSFATRKKYSEAVGMKNYKGLSNENSTLLKLLGAKVK